MKLLLASVAMLLAIPGTGGAAPFRPSTTDNPASNGTLNEDVRISRGGNVLAFSSTWKYVPSDGNASMDVYLVRGGDSGFPSGHAELVSVALHGESADADSWEPAVSADGRWIAFTSRATNLVDAPCPSSGRNVFLRDTITGQTEVVGSAGGTCPYSSGESYGPEISDDGRYVAFLSSSADLVPSDTNERPDAFLLDRLTSKITRVSVASTGSQADDETFDVAMDGTGRIVAFSSWARNLSANDTNGTFDVFVRDVAAQQTTRVSETPSGTGGNLGSLQPSVSSNGLLVAFTSVATNLVAKDTNGLADVFLVNRSTRAISRVSVANEGIESDGSSFQPSVSASGRYVAFTSAGSLTPDDAASKGILDVFVRDMSTSTTWLASRASLLGGLRRLEGDSYGPSLIEGTGIIVAFSTLVPRDQGCTPAPGTRQCDNVDVHVHHSLLVDAGPPLPPLYLPV